MELTYVGVNTGPGPQTVRIRHPNGNVTTLRQRIVYHSPDGFQWGYGGSGPADLALNMLYDYLLRSGYGRGAKAVATALHYRFKRRLIATAPRHLQVRASDIETFLKEKRHADHRAATREAAEVPRQQ